MKSTVLIILFIAAAMYGLYIMYAQSQLAPTNTEKAQTYNEKKDVGSHSNYSQPNEFPKRTEPEFKTSEAKTVPEQQAPVKPPLSPDEMYELQLNEEYSSIPSTIPELPAIPDEMLEAERAYNEQPTKTLEMTAAAPLLLPEDHTNSGMDIEPIPASQPALNEEILNAESDYTNQLTYGSLKSAKAFDGPLLDPETGTLANEEFNTQTDDLPSVEPESPVVILK